MGTVPVNFPPGFLMQIGQIFTANKLNMGRSFANTVFFSAPVSGLYFASIALQIISTDAAGGLTATLTTPTGAATIGSETAPAIDAYAPCFPVWLNRGQQLKASAAAQFSTGTRYNVFVTAQRAF